MAVNTKNAHVRRGPASRGSRAKPSVQANEADRLLNDPAFIRGFDGTEEAIVSLICSTQHNGSPECDAAEREMCRSLRTLRGLKRLISMTVQGHKLRLADFQAKQDDEE